jgi:ABC-type glycerol-3-phosphate transport system substrate-binding protein
MKKIFSKITAVITTIFIIAFCSSCNKDSNTAQEVINYYSAEKLLDVDSVDDAVKINDNFYCIITESKNGEIGMQNQRYALLKTDLSGQELSKTFLSDVFSDDLYITYEYLTVASGEIYAVKRLSSVVVNTDGSTTGEILYDIVKLSESEEKILNINTVIESQDPNLSINAFTVNNKNGEIFAYIYTDKSYAVNIKSGERVYTSDVNAGSFRVFCETPDGSMGLISEHITPDGNIQEIAVINTDTKSLEKGVTFPIKGTAVKGDGIYDYYSFNRTGLFGYKTDKFIEEKIADLATSTLSIVDIQKLIPLSEARFAVIASDAVIRSKGLYILNKAERGDSKIILTIGMMFEQANIREMTDAFNRENPDYFVNLKIYGDDSGVLSADSPWITALNNDIIAEDVLDGLFIGYGISFSNYANKDAFIDIYKLIDDDPELTRKDFVKPFLSVLESGKSLYRIAPHFYLQTLVAKTSLVGKKPGLSFSELKKIADENNMLLLSNYFSRIRFFDTNGLFRVSNFVDENKGTCSFDTPEFIELLNYAKSLPETSDISARDIDSNTFKNNIALVDYAWISDFRDIQEIEKEFGEPVTFIGFPNETGGSGIVAEPTETISIMASSSHPDGVWEYIKYHLKYKSPATLNLGNAPIGSFPLLLSEFDESAAKALEEPYTIIMETGEKLYYSEIGRTAKFPQNTADDNKKTIDLIDNIDSNFSSDPIISNIIIEEVWDFYSGQNTAENTARLIQDRVSTYLAEIQ